jgi:diguanylate cyclase (GGDEF)-like protein
LLRLHRALRALSAGNRLLLRADNEPDLLTGMCRVMVDDCGYRSAFVGYAEHNERKTISLVAHAAAVDHEPLTDEFVASIPVTWDDSELGRSPAGMAIRTGRPCIMRNVLLDEDFAPWRDLAARFGYASVSAFPLRMDGNVVGMLGVTAPEPDAFDDLEFALLGELADDLAYGIANHRLRTQHREAEAMIRRMAYVDALTGLPNRSQFMEALEAALAIAARDHRPLALLMLGTARLREINDTLGYVQGDTLLQAMSARLMQKCDAETTLARVGESEFALVLSAADADAATAAAHDLAAWMQAPLPVGALMIDARVVVGIALFPGHGADPPLLLRRARVAMVEAFRRGRAVAFFSQSLDDARARRLSLLGDLRQAIERDELMLYCQPKLRLDSNRIEGAEALVRWRHPLLGEVSPNEFVKLAEQAGLMTQLTRWVINAAFRQRHAWHQSGIDQPLSVNLSALDLRDPTLLYRLAGLYATWGARPEWIAFELTESALMEHPRSAIETLARLKALGAKLFVDDYGIGYSSLSYLQKLPVDAIKIDQSFVMAMTESKESAAIVRSAVDLGHDLGLQVVAEGVESALACERVKALACDVAQGYYIAKPMPSAEFGTWMASSQWVGAASGMPPA